MLPLRDRLATRRVPVVNYILLAVNILVFVWERALLGAGVRPNLLLLEWGLVPRHLVEAPLAEIPTIFSSMFMHDPQNFLHIGANMLYLWIFGDNVEDALGSLGYATFYLLCGVAAAAAQVLIDPSSPIPMVGASGAIAGVLAAYGSLYPRSPITVVNPIPILWFIFGLTFELPAWIIILEFFLINLMSGLGSVGAEQGGVAFFAHLGGFVAGLVLVRFFRIGGPPARQHDRWSGFQPPRGQARRDPFR